MKIQLTIKALQVWISCAKKCFMYYFALGKEIYLYVYFPWQSNTQHFKAIKTLDG